MEAISPICHRFNPYRLSNICLFCKREKKDYKTFQNVSEHQTRHRSIIWTNSAFISGIAFPVAAPHRANSIAYTHQSKDHLSCINLQELDISMLYKIHTTKGHNFPGEHSDYAGNVRCERSEPTLQQDASHHSRWVLHCRNFSLVIH